MPLISTLFPMLVLVCLTGFSFFSEHEVRLLVFLFSLPNNSSCWIAFHVLVGLCLLYVFCLSFFDFLKFAIICLGVDILVYLSLSLSLSLYLSSLSSLSDSTRVWTQTLMLTRLEPFCFTYFSDRVSRFCPWLTLACYPPTYTSCVARIKDVFYHHLACLLRWGLINLLPS
jgi:hypothetical protein